MMNYGAEKPAGRPGADFAATLLDTSHSAPEPDDAATTDEAQETTLLEDRAPSTTKPPPFPEMAIGGEDEEMTRMEQVPPEVLAELMARAQEAPPPTPPMKSAPLTTPPAPKANPFDDEPTRMGVDVSELAARLSAAPNATQLGVPAIAIPPAAPAAPTPPPLNPRNMATQLGMPPSPGGIPEPPRPLSSVPPPPMPLPHTEPEGPRTAEQRRALGGTLFGLQSPAQAALATPPPPAPPHAAPAAAPGPSIAPVLSVPAQPLQPGQPAPRRVPNAAPTLLGGVISAALNERKAAPPPPGAPPPQGIQPHTALPPVATGAPGAPWAAPPGHPLHRPDAAPAPVGAPAHFAPPAAPPALGAPVAATPKKSGFPVGIVLLLLGGIVVAGGAAGLYFFRGYDASTMMTSIDASGTDLEFTCAECPDGTTLSLGATFSGQRARVILPKPLDVGDHTLDAVLQAPGESAKNVKLPVSLEFRLDVDTSKLHEYPPALVIVPQVRPGGTLTIADKPAAGPVTIPVGDAATGVRDTIAKVSLDVPYKYERAGAPPHVGALHEELSVLPLRLFSPKDGAFTADANVTVQGQAPPGIDVHVGDAVVKPDAQGLFQVSRPLVAGDNEIALWLSRPEAGRAGVSRGLPLRVVRAAGAASLWSEAKAKLDAQKPGDLNALYTEPAGSIGSSFAFAGAIVEAQTQRGETIALIDGSPAAANLKANDPLACKASSCLLRVVASGTSRFAKGERVRGIGRSVTPRDPKTPEVEAQVLLSLQENK